jgi:hypothetical protein
MRRSKFIDIDNPFRHAIQSKDLTEGVDFIKFEPVQDDSWIKEKMRAERITLAYAVFKRLSL